MAAQEITPRQKQESKEQEQTRSGRHYTPDVDIYEDANALWISADMPGVPQSSVTAELNENVLTLHGEVALAPYEGLQPLYTEYNVGNFVRRFTLRNGAEFDASGITATMSHGVLEIRLPKAERVKPRRITVTGG